MSEFNWQTEADAWEELTTETAVSSLSRSTSRRRYLRRAFVFLVLSLTAFFIVRQQVNKRVEAATNQIHLDVISSHDVVLQALDSSDYDLFQLVLSGRDEGWTHATKSLLEEQLLFNPTPYGLVWQSSNIEQPTVTLESDLRAGILTFPQQYAFNHGGVTETVTLNQTAVYRQGRERWLYAPPAETFWGEDLLYEGSYLTVRYPLRDADITLRLMQDIEAQLAAVCKQATCPADFNLNVTMAYEPDVWLKLVSEPPALEPTEQMTVTAVSLVGLPVDEAGYDALLNGYLGVIAPAFVTQVVGEINALDPLEEALIQVGLPSGRNIMSALAGVRQMNEMWFAAANTYDFMPLLGDEFTHNSSLSWLKSIASTYDGQDFYDRSALGLQRLSSPPRLQTIHLNREANEAKVVTRLDYVEHSGEQGSVSLDQTVNYAWHLPAGQWQIRSPYSRVWSQRDNWRGEILQVRYYEAEGQLTQALAQAVDLFLIDFCQTIPNDGECPSDIRLDFDISHWEPMFIEQLNQFRDTSRIDLPALTLLGLPADEGGFEALQRIVTVYALRQVVSEIPTAQFLDSRYIESIYRQNLVDLGVMVWQETTEVISTVPPLVNVQMLCYPIQFNDSMVVWRYSPHDGSWQDKRLRRQIGSSFSRYNGDLILTELRYLANDGVESRLWLWPNGHWDGETIIMDWIPGYTFVYPYIMNPMTDFLSVHSYNPLIERSNSYFVDLNQCTDSGCHTISTDTFAQWSPDGTYALVMQPDSRQPGQFYLADNTGELIRSLNLNDYPQWVSNEWFVEMIHNESRLVGYHISTDEPMFELTQTRLADFLKTTTTSFININQVVMVPDGRGEMLITATFLDDSVNQTMSTLISYNWQTEQLRLINTLPNSSLVFPGVSPTGRWLGMYEWTWQREQVSGPLHLIDLTTGMRQTYTLDTLTYPLFYWWTADDNWVLLDDNGRAKLINPDNGRQYTLSPPAPNCSTPHWVYETPT